MTRPNRRGFDEWDQPDMSDPDDPGPGDDDAPPELDASGGPSPELGPQGESEAGRVDTQIVLQDVADASASEPDWTWEQISQSMRVDRHGQVIRDVDSIVTLLACHPSWVGVLAYDARREREVLAAPPPFSGPNEVCPRALVDSDDTRTAIWLVQSAGLGWEYAPGPGVIRAATAEVCRSRSYDPVVDYLTGLTWDGTDRLSDLPHRYLGADDTLWHRVASRKWMRSAVARALRPGAKVDTVLVLEGRQGAGKSSALAALCRDPEWFADTLPPIGGKEALEYCCGPWIIEIAELASLRRSEVETVKSFVSAASPRFRHAYGRRSEDHPRRCVFAATTNDQDRGYLVDPTGGRRFWPVRCGRIDVAAVCRDRDQLWAQAVREFAAGEPWHLSADESELACAEQDGRRQVDPWEQVIRDLGAARGRLTVTECLVALGIPMQDRDQARSNRVARVLQAMGWTRVQRRIDGRREWVYEPCVDAA